MRLISICFLMILCSHAGAQEYQLSKPIVNVENNGFFQDQADVSLDFKLDGATLRYTLDGSEPRRSSKRYKNALTFNEHGILKVKAFKKGFLPSETVSYELLKVEERIKKIEITPLPNERYAGNGGLTLTDLQAGSLNIRDGNWLGYNSGPVTMTIDLGKLDQLKEVVLSSLSSPGSWIMPPESVEIFFSSDVSSFVKMSEVRILPLTKIESSKKVYYSISAGNRKTRYIKLIIKPMSELPDWHPGKGNAAWFFMDEIIIR